MQPSPELTPSIRLPVVVLSTERHIVKISTLLLSEITGSCRTGLKKRMNILDHNSHLGKITYSN